MEEKDIVIKFRGEVRKITPEEIIFLEHSQRKVFFYLTKETCGTYGKIESYIEKLPPEFYKCNKSYVINLDKVTRMMDQIVYFSDGRDIWLGKQSFCGAKKAFLKFALQISNPVG